MPSPTRFLNKSCPNKSQIVTYYVDYYLFL
jgi:hypothetical protein